MKHALKYEGNLTGVQKRCFAGARSDRDDIDSSASEAVPTLAIGDRFVGLRPPLMTGLVSLIDEWRGSAMGLLRRDDAVYRFKTSCNQLRSMSIN